MKITSIGLQAALLALVLGNFVPQASAREFLSHLPMRPLPVPSNRPPGEGPGYYVDAEKGDDAADGSIAKPWRTINHSLRQLKAGDTLYLRSGTYYEHVVVPTSGQAKRPITIRSYPEELATLDGGLREFLEQPQTAWQPFSDGAKDEYVSTRTYPAFAERPILHAFISNGWEPFFGLEDQRPVVLGHFGDSLVPLHGYRTLADLRDESMLWDVSNKADREEGVYCGPGLWFNRQSGRIHVRLAHTQLDGLGDLAYRGETDPRKIPLAISGPLGVDVLRINGVNHLVVQDLVLRGASGSPLINIYGADDVTFDGVSVFGGSPGLLVKATGNLRIVNSAFRSLAAPWSSRASMKYRGTPSYVIITQENKPLNHDFEFSHSEFTDGHDFAYIRYVTNLKFHHNYVDNFNDDGLEVGAKTRDHEIYIYQNLISRCLISFTLHEIDRDETPPTVNPGSGVYITRNIVDLRRGTFKGPPKEPDPTGEFLNELGMLCSDHGGPIWPNYYFYHNTVLRADSSFRGYYGFGMGGQGLRHSARRVFNNVFVQLDKLPGLNFVPGYDDVVVDGNLHWGLNDGPEYQGDFFRQNLPALFRKTPLPEGWMKHDLFADPRFTRLARAPDAPFDLTLRPDSPAINAGVSVPAEWFDPLRDADPGQPDLGAIPASQGPWQVGIRGRISIFGDSEK